MGSYTFRWEHPDASEVYVTGTFDDWGKTEKLEKKGDVFEKSVHLPDKDKILYKFVVDNNWQPSPTMPQETDEHGNVNNVLHPHELSPSPAAHTLSSVGPTSTTAGLAGQVPKEKKGSKEEIPGAFPETPSFTTPSTEPGGFSVSPIPATAGPGNPIQLAPGEKVPDPSTLTDNTIQSTVKSDPDLEEPSEFSVKPIPATAGAGNPVHLAPGEKVPDPSTLTDNTIQSTVKSDPDLEPSEFSVKPIPATAGAGNPVQLAPGEKVPDPSTLTGNTIGSTVKTDQESYEKSDAGAAVAPPTSSSEKPKDAGFAGGMFGVPPISGNMIPESSLPMGEGTAKDTDPGVTIQSAAPESTTAMLAGQVPKEPRGVPEIVTESQKEAHVDPEAAANREAVEEKKEVEEELKKKVPEEPVTSQTGGLSTGELAAVASGTIAAAGAAVAGATAAAKDKTSNVAADASTAYKGMAPEGVQKSIDGMNSASDGVPAVVKESLEKAHQSPEAAANPEAVKEKHAVEEELEKKISPTNQAGEPAPVVTAESSATAPGSGLSPDALASSEPLKSSSEPDALNATAAKPAQTDATKENTIPGKVTPEPVKNGGPTVTSGVGTTSTETKTEAGPATPKNDTTTPAVDTPASKADTTETNSKAEKKSRRKSLFNKIKKLLH